MPSVRTSIRRCPARPGGRGRLGRPGRLAPTSASSAPARGPSPRAKGPRVGPPTVKTVTLVTGDVVQVSTGADGKQSVTLRPRPDGTIPQAAINQVHDHLYVVPTEAFGLLAAHRLDRDLFDVTALHRGGVRRRVARDAAGHGRLRQGPHGRGRVARRVRARRQAHRDRAPARHRRVPRREGGRAERSGPTSPQGRTPPATRPRWRTAPPASTSTVASRSRSRTRSRRSTPRGLGRRVRRHRHHRRRPRHRLRPDPPRPPGPRRRRRPTSPPTRPSPTATATARTSPRRSAAAVPPPAGCARASRPAPT